MNILEIKPLNITKYLNYLAFKEGLFLYFNRNKNLSLTEKSLLFDKIRALKNSMNTLRTNFVLPDDQKIIITPYWLLGFMSFFFIKKKRRRRWFIQCFYFKQFPFEI